MNTLRGPDAELSGAPVRSLARVVAWVLLLAGRALLVMAPLSVVAARMTQPSWAHAPLDAGGLPSHVIPQATMALAILAGLASPALVLPLGSVWLTTVADGVLTVPTVLGRRSVQMDSVRIAAWWLPGKGWSSWFYVLTDARGKRVVVGHSTLRDLPPEFQDHVTRDVGGHQRWSSGAPLALQQGPPLSLARRAMVYGVGWAAVLAWGCSALLVASVVFVLIAP